MKNFTGLKRIRLRHHYFNAWIQNGKRDKTLPLVRWSRIKEVNDFNITIIQTELDKRFTGSGQMRLPKHNRNTQYISEVLINQNNEEVYLTYHTRTQRSKRIRQLMKAEGELYQLITWRTKSLKVKDYKQSTLREKQNRITEKEKKMSKRAKRR